jgi:type I restriction enzyme M protein
VHPLVPFPCPSVGAWKGPELKAHLTPELSDLGSPKEIAFEVADRLDEAAAHFRLVAEALP